jgi:Holliday junction DNA helicase RuvA
MIGYLEGKLRQKTPDYLLLDVNGVGYFVQVPLSTFYDLPGVGGTASLFVHTHVREDALQLYGFRTNEEKEAFLHLIAVNGVGPRLAVNILSGIQPNELQQAVKNQDRKRLQSIPGVGRKTAERILIELRDRLKLGSDSDAGPSPSPVPGDIYTDALSALLNLGYRPAEAGRVLGQAQKRLGPDPQLESLLKEALRALASV